MLQVDQSVNLLDSLNAASRCDAIKFLLQTLKCKYPEACDRVVRNLFSHKPNDNGADTESESESKQLAKSKQLQLLLATKKEKIEPGTIIDGSVSVSKIKRESDNEASSAIDLNQNFEKILCKEEFMCLDEEDDFLNDDDADADNDGDADVDADADTENSSSMSKRLHFHRSASGSNNVDAITAAGSGAGLLTSDPLDLIHSAAAASGLVKRKYVATFDEEEDEEDEDDDEADDVENESNSNSCEELLLRRQQKLIRSRALVKRKRTNNIISNMDAVSPVTRSRLGEGYVFHEDTQYTLRYHHSSGEFSERAFKAQFRVLLRLALSQHHKPFLKQFYDNFVVTGRLLGTTPSTRVLTELREQRLDEWRRQRERRQQAKDAAKDAAAAAVAALRELEEKRMAV